MKEILRNIDELGRIVIPLEIRKALLWDERTKLKVTQIHKGVLLEPSTETCPLCGREAKVELINRNRICAPCICDVNKKA